MTISPETTRASAPASSARGRILKRIAVLLAVAITAWHIFASFLWIAPPTPLRELVPGNLLTSYMIPWFGQSWSVFAPEPINGDCHLTVRAVLLKNGEETVTDWVSATDVEQSMARHNLFPPRAANMAIKTASNLKGAWEKLSAEQKDIAALNYFKNDDWLGRMQTAMGDVGTSRTDPEIVSYIVKERYTIAYSVQVAKAVWGDDVVRVQYEVSRQNIVPFEQRNNPDAERPAPTIVPTGWRGIIELPDQSSKNFRDVFLPTYERLEDQ